MSGAATLAARPPTAEEMDAEWEGILSSNDDSDGEEDGDEEEDDDEDDDLMLTDEELLATDATEGGYLGGVGDQDEEEEEQGELRGGAGKGKRRKPRVWYDSYKARMKAEKARAAAWQEKRKTFSKAHNDYLDESQRNREIAAARYVCSVCQCVPPYSRVTLDRCDVRPLVCAQSPSNKGWVAKQ